MSDYSGYDMAIKEKNDRLEAKDAEIKRLLSHIAALERAGAGVTVTEEIAAERRRQVESEGWTAEHDDEHDGGEIAYAAACYALASRLPWASSLNSIISRLWPWSTEWWKPQGGDRRNLVKAAALIVAEIERLDRAALVAALTGKREKD